LIFSKALLSEFLEVLFNVNGAFEYGKNVSLSGRD